MVNTKSIFLDVCAYPEALPVKAPENVVAVIVLVEGLIETVETVEVAAPDTEPVAGVNIIGWLALVVAATTFTFCPVVAVPETLDTVSKSVAGLYFKVASVETAIPATKPFCGENKIK